jgi:hypothetical protein
MVPLDDLDEWKSAVLKDCGTGGDVATSGTCRREFLRQGLKALGGVAVAGTLLGALGPSSLAQAAPSGAPASKNAVTTGTFFFPRLKFEATQMPEDPYPDAWDVYPWADVKLRRELRRLTNINVSEEPVVVSLDDLETLVRYPFVFATDERHFRFSKKQEDNLTEFLLRGGFIFGDDCVLKNQSLFFRDFRAMMNRVWPDNPMRRVPDDHALYHCYFDLPKGLPYLQGEDLGAWATFDRRSDRILALVTPTDIHCGWTGWFFTPEQNIASLKMGINIIIYYLSH